MKIKHIHFIINPAAGQDEPILSYINRTFLDSGIEWDISITKKAGDAEKFARKLTGKTDVIAVYGGDGSVMEVAQALFRKKQAMAIIPGGTANVLAKELNIPVDSKAALALLKENYTVKTIDMGMANDQPFVIRINMGILADMVIQTDREMKTNLGQLAYGITTFQTLAQAQSVDYTITIDGETIEETGVALTVTNSGNIGIEGFSFLPDIDITDGWLDLILMNEVDFLSVLRVAGSTLFQMESDVLKRWKGKKITISTPQPQHYICDDCILETQHLVLKVVKKALHVITPQQL
jgi:YegS/Rv2252/BmrU family lipid kinase